MPVSPLCLIVLCIALVAPVHAQEVGLRDVSAERVLADRIERVKTNDGGMAERRSTLIYDPKRGEYVTTVYDASGRVLHRSVDSSRMIGPSPDEARSAERLIRSHTDIAALIASADHPVTVSGGFPLSREASHACGPGSRCVMYDVYEVAPAPQKRGRSTARRLRFVVVDLRTLRLIDADFDAAVDGNFANPAVRARSRARGLR